MMGGCVAVKTMWTREELHTRVKMELRARDQKWCTALTNGLSPEYMETVLMWYNLPERPDDS